MTTEEKLMTIQTLGKLLEANYPYTKWSLDGTPQGPPIPKSVVDSSDRIKILAKIVELTESFRPNEPTTRTTKIEAFKEGPKVDNGLV